MLNHAVLQKQDAFSPEVCGIQLPNEAYLIKELVSIEFSRWNYGFIGRGIKGAVGLKVEEKRFLSIHDAHSANSVPRPTLPSSSASWVLCHTCPARTAPSQTLV